jgi:hypothetical protein
MCVCVCACACACVCVCVCVAESGSRDVMACQISMKTEVATLQELALTVAGLSILVFRTEVAALF